AMIGIIDYGLSNLRSVSGAIEKLGHRCVISSDVKVLSDCQKLILPGVGAFGDGMKNLRDRNLIEPLNDMVLGSKKPILGICLGAQLMCRESYEFGHWPGLNWLDAAVLKMNANGMRVPHVGWNDCLRVKDCSLYEELPERMLYYFVHSYFIQPDDHSIVTGECEYGGKFTASVQKDNISATQFHPEKSQIYGLKVLKNFIEKA
ncbi:MAG: imidazole glycerol phosphate synthase subunit HisH, partial [Candidatus Omnitrophica bacterium]|nr:imidazole glycerol phosphate synthase subunit HisH [Candidatus Omnitrophota bacterium]